MKCLIIENDFELYLEYVDDDDHHQGMPTARIHLALSLFLSPSVPIDYHFW